MTPRPSRPYLFFLLQASRTRVGMQIVCVASRVLQMAKLASALAHLKAKQTAFFSAKSAKIACCAHRWLQKTALKAQRGSKSQRPKAQKRAL